MHKNNLIEKMIEGIIYKYTSPSNKVYIGQTIKRREKVRKREHLHRAKNLKEGALSKAILKYGFDNFKYEVLCCVSADTMKELKDKLNVLEIDYIKQCKSNRKEFGYNLTDGGGGALGFNISEDARKKLSEARKGEKNPMYGKKLSAETIEKISGKNNHNYGKPRPIEAIRKTADKNRGRKRSQEVIDMIKENWKHRDRSTCNTSKMHASAVWILPDGSERIMKICHVKRFHKDWIMKECLTNNTIGAWADSQPHRAEEGE